MYACQSLPIGHHSNARMRKPLRPRLIPTPTFLNLRSSCILAKCGKKPCGNKRKRTRGSNSIVERIVFRNCTGTQKGCPRESLSLG